jgi:hypothetical protein
MNIQAKHSPQSFVMVVDIDRYCFPHVQVDEVAVVDLDESVYE